jgi:siroheme synthase-like protein
LSGYPIILDGHKLRALVVGGGPVAARRLAALLDAGAEVRVVAPELSPQAQAVVVAHGVEWTRAEYASEMLGDVNIIFAATSSAAVNAMVASDAGRVGCLVNVASGAAEGNFFTPAVHKLGSAVIAVFAGGVPAAAARIRDHIAGLLDPRLADALGRLARMRKEELGGNEPGRWLDASRELLAEDFVASVGNGEFERRLQRWR